MRSQSYRGQFGFTHDGIYFHFTIQGTSPPQKTQPTVISGNVWTYDALSGFHVVPGFADPPWQLLHAIIL